jgi:hypothetical protein
VALPGEFGIFEDGGELFQGLASDRAAAGTFAFWRRDIEQVGIEPQTGDDTDMAADGREKVDRRERTVGDQHDVAIGKPAVNLEGGLPGPIEQLLGRAWFAGIEALGGRKQGQEGQRHDAVGPRHAYEQHGGKPTQAAGFDEATFGGTNRIAIDAAGADLGSPTPLDGVINPDHHRGSGGYEGLDQQEQQSARDRARCPCGAIEDAVKGAEVGIVIASQDA